MPWALKAASLTPLPFKSIIGSDDYYGAVLYPGTFGINGYKFCQALKQQLLTMDVDVYEETPATDVTPHKVTTPEGTITAEQIIICTDRYTPDIGLLYDEIFHAQTFLTVSAPLTDQQINRYSHRAISWYAIAI